MVRSLRPFVVTDIAAVAELARPRGIIVVADNTFASPINQRPHDLGAAVVVHSATKLFLWRGVMTEEQMRIAGIPSNLVRFSVGLEHVDDLKADVWQALQAV